jgi:hypothetical protein
MRRGAVLDDGQDIGLGAVEQVGGEEVQRQDRLRLGPQEFSPPRAVPAGRLDNVAFVGPWDIDLVAVRCRVHLWYGKRDPWAPPANGQWLRDHLADAELVIYSGKDTWKRCAIGRRSFTHSPARANARRRGPHGHSASPEQAAATAHAPGESNFPELDPRYEG